VAAGHVWLETWCVYISNTVIYRLLQFKIRTDVNIF
jgi:hypothetical protein